MLVSGEVSMCSDGRDGCDPAGTCKLKPLEARTPNLNTNLTKALRVAPSKFGRRKSATSLLAWLQTRNVSCEAAKVLQGHQEF